MILAMLLGMVVNVGLQTDHKVKMQNAADAATYSGGIVLARGMNTLAFTNHLLCDVFALTAYMREARDRNAESLAYDILPAWSKVGSLFQQSKFPKFQRLGGAITQKVPLEKEMVYSFSEWAAASSELVLPTLEAILEERQIPEFQRALVMVTPPLAQVAANEVALQYARGADPPGGMGAGAAPPTGGSTTGSRRWSNLGVQGGPTERVFRAVIWRTIVDPVGGAAEQQWRTLPVVDPVMDDVPDRQKYIDISKTQRERLSHRYLADWNNETLRSFDYEGKMSQFANFWRGFTCGHLEKLLNEEYPYDNLLFVIRTQQDEIQDVNAHLELDFQFVGVVYSPKIPELLPGLFENPIESDAQTFCQIMLFIPEPRLVKGWRRTDQPPQNQMEHIGGVPGDVIGVAQNPFPDEEPDPNDPRWEWYVYRESRPRHWDLLNQNWTVQLMPARTQKLADILRTPPRLPGLGLEGLTLPELRGVNRADVDEINSH